MDRDQLLESLQKLIEKVAPESEEAWRERVLKAIEDEPDATVLEDPRALSVVLEEIKKANAEIAELREAQFWIGYALGHGIDVDSFL